VRIGLLNNLRAGKNDAQVNRLLGFLRRHPDVLHVETGSAHVVPEALSDLARQEVDILVVNGGDGTLQTALTEILHNGVFGERTPMIAPLRGGRTNMSALDIGCCRDPVKGLGELLADVHAGDVSKRIVSRRVLRVQYGLQRNVEYGTFFGLGLIHRAIELNHRVFTTGAARHAQGVVGATMVTGGLLGRLAMGENDGILLPDKVQVLLDGEPMAQGEFYLMIASTLSRLFAGMRPFWGVGPGGVRFTSMASNAQRMSSSFAGILRGRPGDFVTEENGYTSRNLDRVQLRLDCGFTVDGELFDPEPGRVVELTADRTVRFVRT